MEKSGLSAQEMEVVRAVFHAADDDSANSYLIPEEREAIMEFRYGLTYGTKPYLLVSPDGIANINETVMKHPLILDYVFSLYGRFTARWAQDDDATHALHENLARGLCVAHPGKGNQELSATHPQIADRLSTKSDIVQLLDNTPWLTMLILHNVFPNFKVKAGKSNQRQQQQVGVEPTAS